MGINGVILVLTVIALAGFGLLLWQSPAAYGYLLMEDTPAEWMGFYCLAAAGIAFLVGARHRRSHPASAAACGLLAALCAFVAGEEISWGQRILGFAPPSFFAFHNAQRELNVHNLAVPWMNFRLFGLSFSVGYGVVVPLLGRPLARRGAPVPPWGVVPAFATAAWLFTLPVTKTDDEVGELLFALGMLGAGLAAGFGPRGARPMRRLSLMLPLLATLTSWASFQSAPERAHAQYVGPLQAGQAYEGLRRWEDAAREYEKLARFWGSDWNLWVKVVELYRAAGNYPKAYALAVELSRIHRREPRLWGALLELGDSLAIPDDARARVEEQVAMALEEEPATPDDEEDRAFLVELAVRLRQ